MPDTSASRDGLRRPPRRASEHGAAEGLSHSRRICAFCTSTGIAHEPSIALEYDLPHPPAKVWRALTDPKLLAAPANAFAFDGATKGWERMLGQGLPDVLAREARSGGC